VNAGGAALRENAAKASMPFRRVHGQIQSQAPIASVLINGLQKFLETVSSFGELFWTPTGPAVRGTVAAGITLIANL
jgi:hypothetical protein